MMVFLLVQGNVHGNIPLQGSLKTIYLNNNLSRKEMDQLKLKTLKLAGKAVPALIEVMKSGKYPDKNRWMATFLLGKIMGKKGSPFIAKFLEHPSWVMRMASLKTLLALKENRYAKDFAAKLKDNSLIVRTQALENIKRLKLRSTSPHVWSMLYDKKNYYESSKDKKTKKRTNIIRNVIQTVGILEFKKAKVPLMKMIQKKTYNDIFVDIDRTLGQLFGKSSPKGGRHIKRHYWKRMLTSYASI